jgi:4,5-DOPA dioxygenase extradiol
MTEKRMPAVFAGHGSPMLALENNEMTASLQNLGKRILKEFGKPKGIIVISAHWYTRGSFVQSEEDPKQVYDMYGFPKKLYDFQYPVKGSPELAEKVKELLKGKVQVSNDWGIDHGTWTVLCHMFPDANIPVVQLSVNGIVSPGENYEIGKALETLRDDGYLILGSGNVVHNLRMLEWDNPNGSEKAVRFNNYIKENVKARNDQAAVDFYNHPDAEYAAPSPEHFLPLLYILGASQNEKPEIFNDISSHGSLSMTGYAFGMPEKQNQIQ